MDLEELELRFRAIKGRKERDYFRRNPGAAYSL